MTSSCEFILALSLWFEIVSTCDCVQLVHEIHPLEFEMKISVAVTLELEIFSFALPRSIRCVDCIMERTVVSFDGALSVE